jgi:putative transposase
MEAYKRGGHTVWDCKYHLVWVTKYRYSVLGGDVGARCRELLRETARAHEMRAGFENLNSRLSGFSA